jgi:hypothetical protein
VKPILGITLAEETAERVRRSHHEAIRELQQAPMAGARVVKNITLVDGIETSVAHGLGREPTMFYLSPPRGPSSTGRIEEVRGTQDRSKLVVIKASGMGATITVDGVFW